MATESQCVNCNNALLGNFCHHCGQKVDVPKLTFKSLLVDLQQRLFGFDGRVLNTIRDMTIRPEKVVQSFLSGVRVYYVGPVGYYFLLLTVFVLLTSALNVEMKEYTAATNDLFGVGKSDNAKAQEALQETMFGNFRVLSFVMIPGFIFATFILFYKSKLNIIQTAVFTFYTQAHPMLLSIIGLFLFKFTHSPVVITYVAPVSFIYYAYSAVRFFKHNSPVWSFIKGLLVTVLGVIFFAFLVLFAMAIYGFIDPEGMKALIGTSGQ